MRRMGRSGALLTALLAVALLVPVLSFGGRRLAGSVLPSTLTWQLLSEHRLGDAEGAAVALNGAQLYAIGGAQLRAAVAEKVAFLTADGKEWTAQQLSFPIRDTVPVTHNGELLLLGGRYCASASSCPPTQNIFRLRGAAADYPLLPEGLERMAALSYQGTLWLLGGASYAGGASSVVYKLQDNAWEDAGVLPADTSRGLAAVFGGRMYYVEDAVGGGRRVLWSEDGAEWTDASVLPESYAPLTSLRLLVHGDSLWIVDGHTGHALVSPDGTSWQEVTATTPVSSGVQAWTALDVLSWAGKLVLVGDVSSSGERLRRILVSPPGTLPAVPPATPPASPSSSSLTARSSSSPSSVSSASSPSSISSVSSISSLPSISSLSSAPSLRRSSSSAPSISRASPCGSALSTVFCTTENGARACKRLCANPPATPTVDAFLCPPGERLHFFRCDLQGSPSCTYVCVPREPAS